MSASVPSPRLLVSVRDPDEAVIALQAGADLVDAKDPARGALGALPAEVVRAVVARVGGAAGTSAVAGEPESEAALVARVADIAASGVDYVKVALDARWEAGALAQAAAAAPGRLIGVLFAEDGLRTDIVARLAEAGFCGAMIDTSGKDGRRLTDHLGAQALSAFTAACRSHRLLSGLAGSLCVGDIAALAPHAPGYLGFRGGLCEGGDRSRPLDPMRVREAACALRVLRCRDAA